MRTTYDTTNSVEQWWGETSVYGWFDQDLTADEVAGVFGAGQADLVLATTGAGTHDRSQSGSAQLLMGTATDRPGTVLSGVQHGAVSRVFTAGPANPNYPSLQDRNAGDLLLLTVYYKPAAANTGTITTPSGWTLLGDTGYMGGFGSSIGADVGNMRIANYWRIDDGALTGSFTVDVSEPTIGVLHAQVRHYPGFGRGDWDLAMASANLDTSSSTPSVTFDQSVDIQDGDMVFVGGLTPTDIDVSPTMAGYALSAPGITTWDAITEVLDSAASSGTDSTIYAIEATASGGAQAGPATLSFTIEGDTTNQRGPLSMVRIRRLRYAEPVNGDVQVWAGPMLNAAATTFGTPVAPRHIPDDVLVVVSVQDGTGGDIAIQSGGTGWTTEYQADVTTRKFLVLSKVATSTNETIPTLECVLSSGVSQSIVLVFRGAETDSPFDVAPTATNYTNGPTTDAHPAITTLTDRALAVFVANYDNDAGYPLRTSGLDSIADEGTVLGADSRLSVFVKDMPTAGSTGTVSFESVAIAAGSSLRFAIMANGAAAFNPTGSGTATLTLGSSGAGTVDFPGSGSSALTLGSSGAGSVAVEGGASAGITLASSGTGFPDFPGSGTLALTLGTGSGGSVAVSGDSSAVLDLTGLGAATMAVSAGGSATLDLTTVGAGSGGVQGDGTATLDLSALGAGLPDFPGFGTALLELATVGAGAGVEGFPDWHQTVSTPWAQTNDLAWTEQQSNPAWTATDDETWRQQSQDGWS